MSIMRIYIAGPIASRKNTYKQDFAKAELEGWKKVENQQSIKISILEGDKDNGSEV